MQVGLKVESCVVVLLGSFSDLIVCKIPMLPCEIFFSFSESELVLG